MNSLGNRNLLTSTYVNGTSLSQSTFIKCIEAIRNWVEWKDTDWAMSQYRMGRTNRITVMHHIPLDTLKEVLVDLVTIYKSKYPYSDRTDFFESVLANTVYELECILEFPHLRTICYGSPLENPRNVYFYLDTNDNEYWDFILEANHDFDFYRQYHRAVLELFKNFDFDTVVQIAETTKPATNSKIAALTNDVQGSYPQQLTLRQIAFLYAYKEKEPITRKNADDVAKRFGHTSGESLYQKFLKYVKPIDRRGDEGTKIKNTNKIKCIRSILNHLEINELDTAKEDIATLEEIVEYQYS